MIVQPQNATCYVLLKSSTVLAKLLLTHNQTMPLWVFYATCAKYRLDIWTFGQNYICPYSPALGCCCVILCQYL